MKKRAFTLIEVLMALAVFSVVIMIAVGAFVNAWRTQRQVASLIAAQSNGSLALEQMAREIRTGYYFCATASSTLAGGYKDTPSPGCASACSVLVSNNNPPPPDVWQCSLLDFWNAQGCEVQYALSASGSILRSNQCDASPALRPITSDNVKVSNLVFTIFGNMGDDYWDPRITISMALGANSNDPQIASTTLNLQTTVSARDCGSLAGGC